MRFALAFAKEINTKQHIELDVQLIQLEQLFNIARIHGQSQNEDEANYYNRIINFFFQSCTITFAHLTNAQIADLLVQVFDDIDSCCANTVMNARHELQFQFSPPRRSVYVSPNAQKKRVDWCNFHIIKHTDSHNVVFSDESYFELGSDKRWVWRRKSDYSPNVCFHRVAHLKKILIWGAIGYNLRSKLIFMEESVNSENYFIDIILGSDVVTDAD